MLYELRPLCLARSSIVPSPLRRRFWMFVGCRRSSPHQHLTNFASSRTRFHMAKPPVGLAGPGAEASRSLFLGISLLQCSSTCSPTASPSRDDLRDLRRLLGEETSIGGPCASEEALVPLHPHRAVQFGAALWLPFCCSFRCRVCRDPQLRIIGVLLLFSSSQASCNSVIAYIRNSLASPRHRRRPECSAAMRRSKFLVAGHKAACLSSVC